EQTKSHAVFPLSEVHNVHTDSNYREAAWAVSLGAILDRATVNSKLLDTSARRGRGYPLRQAYGASHTFQKYHPDPGKPGMSNGPWTCFRMTLSQNVSPYWIKGTLSQKSRWMSCQSR